MTYLHVNYLLITLKKTNTKQLQGGGQDTKVHFHNSQQEALAW